jgi:hypothetical protein
MEEKPIFELCSKDGILDTKTASKKQKDVWGKYLCLGPSKEPGFEENQNGYSRLNFTGQPGTGSGMYYSLVFNLTKWGWHVDKADEWIEVSPSHKEYYDRTVSTKQMLESTIKQGLISAAQSVADYELMSHDIRKYKEILSYFQNKDENLLRSMFIDQVDVHTDLPGQPIALRSIVGRWPTMIVDFMRLNDNDKIPKDIARDYEISIAEAVILSTKNKLFIQWKKLFGETAKNRYAMLRGLVSSRKKTIDEYKEWLKPYIARFRMTRLGNERIGGRSESLKTFVDITGMQTFGNQIRLFVWKPMKIAEHKKPLTEIRPTLGITNGFVIEPYDDYVRNELILGENGLAKIYPWLRKEVKQCPKCKKYCPKDATKCMDRKCGNLFVESKFYADEIVNDKILPNWTAERGLDPTEPYYMFIDINVFRDGTRLQVGELEDITFTNKMFVISQNIMLVKILELWCRDRELENYIDEMLGMRSDDMSIEDLVKQEIEDLREKPEEDKKVDLPKSIDSYKKTFQEFKKYYSKNFAFMKGGPYERDMKDRISKQYMKFAGAQLGAITAFLKAKMGVE